MTVREQVTKNCHYISRSLTKPWEGPNGHLRFYDFETEGFDTKTSRFLYAEEYLNSQAVEDWLSKYVESPLGLARPALSRGEPGALDDWRMFRAAMLMLWLQGARSRSVREPDQGRSLERLAARTEAEIDGLVVAFRADYDLSLVFGVSIGGKLAPLFVPSTGVFPVTFNDPSRLSGTRVALALPIEMHCALVALPVGLSTRADVSSLPSSISNFSIGPSQATKVVLPPASVVTTPEAELRTALVETRALVSDLVAKVGEAQDTIVDAYAAAGLTVRGGPSGRGQP